MASSHTFPRRLMTAVLGLALLSGCADQAQDPAGNAAPNWLRGEGISPNCLGEAAVVLRQRFDIDDDGRADWFYVFRCPEAAANGRGDQLEVLDGRADLDRPRRLGSGPMIHPDHRITIAGCLMFSAGQVFVADRRSTNGKGWRVVRIGTWQEDQIQTTSAPAKDATLPCDRSRPPKRP